MKIKKQKGTSAPYTEVHSRNHWTSLFFFKKKGSPSGSRSAFLFDRERTVREDSREISSVSLLMGYNSRHNTLLDRLVSQSLLLTWNGY